MLRLSLEPLLFSVVEPRLSFDLPFSLELSRLRVLCLSLGLTAFSEVVELREPAVEVRFTLEALGFSAVELRLSLELLRFFVVELRFSCELLRLSWAELRFSCDLLRFSLVLVLFLLA